MEIKELLKGTLSQYTCPNIVDGRLLTVIDEENFYMEPPIKKVSTNESGWFVLFSSPGAVGKTALAKYIAFQCQALYWNTAVAPVGGTSFAGAISHALGIQNATRIQAFYADLQQGKAAVILDALDEAILISKRSGLEKFLLEIYGILTYNNATMPMHTPIILMARTETAEFIGDIFQKNKIEYQHYSIEYFDAVKATEFIESYLSYKMTDKTAVLSKADMDNIKKYIEIIKLRIVNNEDTDENKKESIGRFIGYAQVLLLLSKQIEQIIENDNNAFTRLSKLSQEWKENEIIYQIINDLLLREEKKLAVFKSNIMEHYNQADKKIIESLYDKDEQLLRLQWYVAENGATDADICSSFNKLTSNDKIEYGNLLKTWLPQHIFLHNGNVLPIFNEYILAECLLDPDKEIDVERNYLQKNRLPTLAFVDCYLKLSGGKVKKEHIYYLVSAYYSQALPDEPIYCFIEESDSDDAKCSGTKLQLTLENPVQARPIIIPIIDDNEPIRLNRVVNMNVRVPGKIVLQTAYNAEVEIRRSKIECDDLEFNAEDVHFIGYDNEENILIAHKSITCDDKCQILVESRLKVDCPSSDMPYIFFSYRYNFEDVTVETRDGLTNFAHALSCVLREFKTDKYNRGPGKHKERIDSICSSGLKRDVLDFLKKREVIYEDRMLYRYNPEKMNNLHISRSAYMCCNDDKHLEQLHFAYDEYLKFRSQICS